ncbi:MAG: amidohydrolase family protein [Planctomycetota bacterium]|jgi:predicted TIM-barrel fold metal-dependent hydrolase
MKIHRRRFIEQTARTALAAGSLGLLKTALTVAAAQAPSPEQPLLPIVDTHQHLWDLSKLRLPWLKSAGHLNRSHVTEDYLEAAEGLNVVKAVYMEVAVEESLLAAEAEYVIDLCGRDDNPTVAAVIGGRPAADDFEQYITRFKGSPFVKGVRHILPGATPDLWSEDAFIRGVRLLGKLGMRFDLCMPPARLPDAARVVDRCPDTRFILDHCGNADPVAFMSSQRREAAGVSRPPQHEPDSWRRELAKLARRDRVVCKISGIVARAPKDTWTADDLAPIVNHCLDVFGPDRVMFASDWPVCTRAASLRQWVSALKTIIEDRPRVEQRKLLHDNAVRFYDLS